MARARSRAAAGAPPLRRNVADLRALAHPLRLRMVELFAESPKTTKQVAEILGEPPTRLYHHVAALERAGLVVLKETRQNRGAVEKWYAGVAQQMQGTEQPGLKSSAGRAARRAVAATVLEQAKHEVMAVPSGAKEAALLARMVIAAPAAKIPAIRKRLYDTVKSLGAEFRAERESGGVEAAAECERWAVTLAFAPVRSPGRTKR